MTRNGVDMGEGKVLSVLLRLGGPAMASMFFQNLYALVDTAFVARLGTVPLAAMALAVPILYLSIALCKGLAVGATALMSHARGAGDPSKAAGVATAALPLALLVLCPFCLLAFPVVNQPIFALFGAEGDVVAEADRYVFWVAWTFPVMGATMLCEGILLSCGDSKTPMKAMIAGNVLNIILDPLLIFTCGLDVAGASLASLIGWALSGGLMYGALLRRGGDLPHMFCSKDSMRHWGDILKQGVPVAVSMLVIPVSLSLFNYVLAGFGPAYVGAWALSARLEQMLFLPLYGLTCALIPFAGFNMGRGNAARIREATRLSVAACYTLILPAAAVLWMNAEFVVGLFKPEPAVLQAAVFALRTAILGYWFGPFELVAVSLAQGLKRSGYTLCINAGRVLFLRVPLAFLFGGLWGGTGVYVSHPTALMVTGLISIFLLRHLLELTNRSCMPLTACEEAA
ncbi:MATE family efflux transporter [Desulfovibrio mangrovi]|uniref:MATE family efflux transporter n=1 Tax=Desulfovibrio mangrovi TaxID=2976983 RepID=UPI0022465971|nr:MATE family efflux transporter [Desulfovibrio mangrovi]UZP68119.1 MATE family efflux transporter [Desulfovibrio mangrovi]